MREMMLNQMLVIEYPDSFHELSEKERKELNAQGSGRWDGLTDPKRHIMLTFGWEKTGGLISLLLRSRDLASGTERRIRRPMKQFGYRLEGFIIRDIAGKQADGFRYTYTASDIDMFGESLVLKYGRTVYYLHLYGREKLRKETLKAWEGILASVKEKRKTE